MVQIDASGTIRANYTNGQNNPLGKIVVANFNNQNGLKQIENATYVETAVSAHLRLVRQARRIWQHSLWFVERSMLISLKSY